MPNKLSPIFIFYLLTLFSLSTNGFSQDLFTKDYYIFPVKPGQQAWLAGSMGEIRTNHFHSGLDIKVGGQIGWPVYAAQDGYIERIKMSNYGYGRAVYIKHPNGETTVYAHLHSFDSKIANYLLKAQYKEEKYELDVYPTKDAITYKQKRSNRQSR